MLRTRHGNTVTTILPVVDVTFARGYPHNLHRLAEIRDDLTRREPLTVVLVREPDNPYDANAVAVHVPSLGTMAHIGHVARELAARLAPKIDEGVQFKAWVHDVRIDPKHIERPGIDIGVQRVTESEG